MDEDRLDMEWVKVGRAWSGRKPARRRVGGGRLGMECMEAGGCGAGEGGSGMEWVEAGQA